MSQTAILRSGKSPKNFIKSPEISSAAAFGSTEKTSLIYIAGLAINKGSGEKHDLCLGGTTRV